MKDSAFIAGTAIPFAAGVAAGTLLAAFPGHIPLSIPLILSIALTALTALIFLVYDSRSGKVGVRVCIGAVFLMAGIFCSVNSALSEGIPVPEGPLSKAARVLGERLKALIDSIPYPSRSTGPLVKALLTGDRGDLDRSIIETFRASGASHILALSGLHLGILYLILTRLASPVGNSPGAKTVKYVLTVAAAGFYTIMTGASPSIVRAFLFIFLGETAKRLGRKRVPSMILLAALTIQLALKPEVISSLGFQLSYLAMTGIVTIFPYLESLYPESKGLPGKVDPFARIWKGAMLTLSCQVFTAPLVWSRFHTFPRYFLLTNLTALPLTSAIVTISVITIALSSVGICPEIIVNLNDRTVQILIYCLRIISSM